jgi:S-adenosylmethionine:tRNA ribosyltransferase-isomerase
MKTSDFDYELPPELIAQKPLAERAASRMMVVNRLTGEIRHDAFRNLGRHLRPGDLLVLNNTKVIPARLWANRPAVEVLLVEDLGDNRWSALVKPGKRARPGATLQFGIPHFFVTIVTNKSENEEAVLLRATVESETDFGGRVLRFDGDVRSYMDRYGAAPLPPYIQRARPDPGDLSRYQTVYARQPGAVAAPTAGLHFTPELLEQFPHAFITLHVGIGTFRPVKVENVEEHKMHAEKFFIPAETLEKMRQAKRVVAVGTTVVRALESGKTEGETDLFIRPGFQFRAVGALLTNFHLPRSTLLMLVSAFASRELILRAYREAVREKYRFFSYGDCMLIV